MGLFSRWKNTLKSFVLPLLFLGSFLDLFFLTSPQSEKRQGFTRDGVSLTLTDGMADAQKPKLDGKAFCRVATDLTSGDDRHVSVVVLYAEETPREDGASFHVAAASVTAIDTVQKQGSWHSGILTYPAYPVLDEASSSGDKKTAAILFSTASDALRLCIEQGASPKTPKSLQRGAIKTKSRPLVSLNGMQ